MFLALKGQHIVLSYAKKKFHGIYIEMLIGMA